MSGDLAITSTRDATDVPLADKVRFLRDPGNYPGEETAIDVAETHFSWVFLTRRHAYKLKKPAAGEGFDFRRVEGRLRNARAELRLNLRLAPNVYLGLVPLTLQPCGALRLNGDGRPVDWLVKMRRLETRWMLDNRLLRHTWRYVELEAVADRLAQFFVTARPARLDAVTYIRNLHSELGRARRAISGCGQPRLLGVGGRVARCLYIFLVRGKRLFHGRLAQRRVIDGHGDLRPEHVYVRGTPQIIDCLEFRSDLRRLDPLSEIAFLALECRRLANSPVGSVLLRRYRQRGGGKLPRELIAFYTAFNALTRARLAIEHVAEPGARTREQWIDRATAYLAAAAQECRVLCR